MASTFSPSVTYGTSPGTTADATYLHLLSSDVAPGNVTNHQNYRVVKLVSGTNYSYERWVRGHWTGSFAGITNVLFWKSSGTPATGITINAADRGSQTYATPVNTASTIATSAVPTSSGAALSLGYATNYSDYIVLQGVVADTASAPADSTGAITYSFQWEET